MRFSRALAGPRRRHTPGDRADPALTPRPTETQDLVALPERGAYELEVGMRTLLGNCPPLGDPRVNGAATGRAVAFARVRWDCGERGQGRYIFRSNIRAWLCGMPRWLRHGSPRSGTGPGTSLLDGGFSAAVP